MMIRHLAATAGHTSRRFDTAAPILDLRLASGHRLFAVTAVAERTSVVIRRHRMLQSSLESLENYGTVTPEMTAVLRAAVRPPNPANMLVVGGTGAGKTTLLRALLSEVPQSELVVTIEDTLELHLRSSGLHERTLALETRTSNTEGMGEISMYDLCKAALRMSPDRVIVGEVRGGEVMQLLQSMGIGNDGSLGTIHAGSTRAAINKMLIYAQRSPDSPTPDSVLREIAEVLHLLVYIKKLPDGRRAITSIREVVSFEDGGVVTSEVFAPGPDGVGIYSTPFKADGEPLARLVSAGFDPEVLGEPYRPGPVVPQSRPQPQQPQPQQPQPTRRQPQPQQPQPQQPQQPRQQPQPQQPRRQPQPQQPPAASAAPTTAATAASAAPPAAPTGPPTTPTTATAASAAPTGPPTTPTTTTTAAPTPPACRRARRTPPRGSGAGLPGAPLATGRADSYAASAGCGPASALCARGTRPIDRHGPGGCRPVRSAGGRWPVRGDHRRTEAARAREEGPAAPVPVPGGAYRAVVVDERHPGHAGPGGRAGLRCVVRHRLGGGRIDRPDRGRDGPVDVAGPPQAPGVHQRDRGLLAVDRADPGSGGGQRLLFEAVTLSADQAPSRLRPQVVQMASIARTLGLPAGLDWFAAEMDSPFADRLVLGMKIAWDSGARVSEAFESTARAMRTEVDMRRRNEVANARAWTQVISMVGVTVGSVLFMFVFNKEFFDPFGTVIGQATLLAVGVLIFGNIYWVLKLSESGIPVRLLAPDGDKLGEGVVAALSREDK